MPHGMFEACYPSQGGKSRNQFIVSDGNLQTHTNVVNVRRHKVSYCRLDYSLTALVFSTWYQP